jgi:hypothetical protein
MPDDVEKNLPAPETPPSLEVAPEAGFEAVPETEHEPVKEQIAEAATPLAAALTSTDAALAVDPTVHTIEKILSEDLYEYFQAMSPAAQAHFKTKGEETVSKLAVLMTKTVIKAKEVLKLIIGWLKIIPGVNKYFLEQESKIKADKILELHKRQHP